jgi:hypothetical protein
MSIEETYINFFLNSKRNEYMVQTLEIYHPSFSKTYYLTPNSFKGLVAEDQEYEFCPMSIKRLSSTSDLEQALSITFGDIGTILQAEMIRVLDDDAHLTKPSCTYKAYSSNDLNTPIMGPYVLEIASVTFTRGGAQFDIRSRIANATGTGRRYTFDRFPSLKGFL